MKHFTLDPRKWRGEPRPVPRQGESIIERFGEEFLGGTQEIRDSVLRVIASEKGSALLRGFDWESILVTTQNTSQEMNLALRPYIKRSDVRYKIQYHPTPMFPLLTFTFAIPDDDKPLFEAEVLINITDADYQDFVSHLPTCYGMSFFWYSQDGVLAFEEEAALTVEVVQEAKTTYKEASRYFWTIPEGVRSFEGAISYYRLHGSRSR